MNHDVFISYRRDRNRNGVGAILASLVKTKLEEAGLRVFMDVRDLDCGDFPEQLEKAIAESGHVVLVLSPGAMDACLSPDDWVRREIETAYANDVPIVPVLHSDFRCPAGLPKHIGEASQHNGVVWSHDYESAAVQKLLAFLGHGTPGLNAVRAGPPATPPGKPSVALRGRPVLLAALGILAAALFAMKAAWSIRDSEKEKGSSDSVPPHERTTGTSSAIGDAPPESRPSRPAGETYRLRICDGYEADMVWCPPGTFNMGSPTSEVGRASDETLHAVRLTHGFWMARHPVTQREWRLVMGSNPSWFKKTDEPSESFRRRMADDAAFDNPDNPVEHVSWFDCTNFLERASAMAGCAIRLPTEAEWEYACRAGSRLPYVWGYALNGDLANVDGRLPCASDKEGPYLGHTTPVGRYSGNAWGLFDMHGNVYEWTQDFYGDYPEAESVDPQGPPFGACKVVRGGNWSNSAKAARSAARCYFVPAAHNARTGFRLCLDSPPEPITTDLPATREP